MMALPDRLKHFSRLSFEDKRQLLSEGRPTPELPDLQQRKGQKIVRTFQTDWYKKKDWLCGCAELNRLFCFPCSLFGSSDNVWTNGGYCDLNNLPGAIAKHEKSVVHIQSQIALKTFGHSRIDLALDEQRRLGISIHNEKVKKNREILKSLIDVVCFLGKQELAFRGNNEGESSSNRGNYVELLHLLASKDANLASHLASSTVFSGTSNRIQNDLIEAITDVLREDIKEELRVAPFVAVEVDETTDITNKAQLSVILRYVSGSEVKETFLGFDDVSDDRRATAISEYVLVVLDKFDCAHKLIAQTYDGASVMASHLNGVQAKIREKIPEAMFTHCYSHKLNLVLSQSAKMIPECKVFFKTVEGLAAYFSKSTKRRNLLHKVVKRRIPRAAATRWNSNSKLVQTIMFHYTELQEVFNLIQENPDDWDGEALAMASGFSLWLSKASTCFLLMTFSAIFTKTGALFRVLQTKVMDIGYCSLRVSDTENVLSKQCQMFDSFYERFQERCEVLSLVDSDPRSKQPVRDQRRGLFYSILDNITVQMEARFKNLGELDFLALVDCKKFDELSVHFDDAKLNSLAKYGKYFDFVRLKADLIGLYSSEIVKDKSPHQLLAFLVENDLEQTVPGATKLLKLVLTIPATTASVERAFSALKRIKTYSRNRTEQGRLSSLGFMAIEKERLIKLKAKSGDFYNAVIDNFLKKERRIDFIFKYSKQ